MPPARRSGVQGCHDVGPGCGWATVRFAGSLVRWRSPAVVPRVRRRAASPGVPRIRVGHGSRQPDIIPVRLVIIFSAVCTIQTVHLASLDRRDTRRVDSRSSPASDAESAVIRFKWPQLGCTIAPVEVGRPPRNDCSGDLPTDAGPRRRTAKAPTRTGPHHVGAVASVGRRNAPRTRSHPPSAPRHPWQGRPPRRRAPLPSLPPRVPALRAGRRSPNLLAFPELHGPYQRVTGFSRAIPTAGSRAGPTHPVVPTA